MSPYSRDGRDFIENALTPEGKDALLKSLRERFNGYSKERIIPKYEESIFKGFYVEDKNGFPDTNSPFYRSLFLADFPMYDSMPNTGIFYFYRPKDLQKEYIWKDVFNMIVDLRAGKVFRRKISPEEKEKVDMEIKKYKELLLKEFQLPEINP